MQNKSPILGLLLTFLIMPSWCFMYVEKNVPTGRVWRWEVTLEPWFNPFSDVGICGNLHHFKELVYLNSCGIK